MKRYKVLLSLLCVLVFVFLAVGSTETDEEPAAEPDEAVEKPEDVVGEEPVEEEKPDDEVTKGEKNALSSALNYLRTMPFSYSGLINQLEYEGYTNEQAVYGADNCGADWNEQAALMAQNYLDTMSLSRDGLIRQLEFEGFTRQQAEYGVQAVGY